MILWYLYPGKWFPQYDNTLHQVLQFTPDITRQAAWCTLPILYLNYTTLYLNYTLTILHCTQTTPKLYYIIPKLYTNYTTLYLSYTQTIPKLYYTIPNLYLYTYICFRQPSLWEPLMGESFHKHTRDWILLWHRSNCNCQPYLSHYQWFSLWTIGLAFTNN